MSDLTKKALAQSLVKLLEKREPNKVTISEITDNCGLTRNTFYYHFHDIYEPLRWFFSDEVEKIMNKYIDNEDWQGGLEEALIFLYEYRKMIRNVYRSVSYDTLLVFINDILYKHARSIILLEAKGLTTSSGAIDLTADFYTNAMVGATLSWIREGMNESPGSLAKTYNEMFSSTLESALISAEKIVR